MTSNIQDDFLDGIHDLYQLAGVPVIHTSRAGAKTRVTGIVEYDLTQWGDVAEIAGQRALVSVRVSELALPPLRGETYTVGDTTYTVDSVLLSDDLEHRAFVA